MSRLLAATLGLVCPRYRTFLQWIEVYEQILESRPLSSKTLNNRHNSIRYLSDEFGHRTISNILPHEIARLTRTLHQLHPCTAQRVLTEAKDIFNEAVAYGWVHTNPAAAIKRQAAPVTRRRLSIQDWRRIHAYAEDFLPPWVAKMMVLALVTAQRRSDLQKMCFSDVKDGYLYVEQQKTGTRIRLPLDLRLDALDTTVRQAIDECRTYAIGDEFLLRKTTGKPLGCASLSARFEEAREGALGMHSGQGAPTSLHECRSLSERLYRTQGIDTQVLLGHKNQAMTDSYNDDRGLTAGEWKTLTLPGQGGQR